MITSIFILINEESRKCITYLSELDILKLDVKDIF